MASIFEDEGFWTALDCIDEEDFSTEEWLERKHGVYGPLHDYTQDEADRRALREDDPPVLRRY